MHSFSRDSTGTTSDTGTLWQNALTDYADETGTDLRRHELSRLAECNTAEHFVDDVEEEMEQFRAFDIDLANWGDMKDVLRRVAECVLMLGQIAALTAFPDVSVHE